MKGSIYILKHFYTILSEYVDGYEQIEYIEDDLVFLNKEDAENYLLLKGYYKANTDFDIWEHKDEDGFTTISLEIIKIDVFQTKEK